MKQETLEEAAIIYAHKSFIWPLNKQGEKQSIPPGQLVPTGYAKHQKIATKHFINGAKWQQKQDIKEPKPNPLLMDEVGHWDFRKSTVDKMKPLQEQWQQDMDKELMKKETLEDNIKNKIMGMNVDTGFRIERTYSDEDLELRKRLWVDVYIAYVSTPNSYNRDGGHVWADKALERFDEQFKKK